MSADASDKFAIVFAAMGVSDYCVSVTFLALSCGGVEMNCSIAFLSVCASSTCVCVFFSVLFVSRVVTVPCTLGEYGDCSLLQAGL